MKIIITPALARRFDVHVAVILGGHRVSALSETPTSALFRSVEDNLQVGPGDKRENVCSGGKKGLLVNFSSSEAASYI